MTVDPNRPTTEDSRSTTGLLSDAMSHISGLLRKEVDLARAEVSENINRAGVALGMIVGAVVVALTALNVLSAALVSALTEAGLEAGWAALLVGVVFAVIAYLMMRKGMADLRLSSIAPTRAAHNVQRDAATLKETYDAR